MKTLKILLPALIMMISLQAVAQVNVNVNIGTAPAWGPAGYTNVRYYYLPDIDTYYDVNTTEYIYINRGHWVRTRTVPVVYRNYNFYNGYKVVLTNYHGGSPYVHYKTHRVKYPRGYHPGRQRTVGVPPGHIKKARVVHASHGRAVVAKKPHSGGHGGRHPKPHPHKEHGHGRH